MARARIIKPEFFRSRSLASCTRDARITFVGLWTEADDAGRGAADERVLKGSIWPLDDEVTSADVRRHLQELSDTGHIVLYEVDGDPYYAIQKWEKHQAAAYRRGEPKHPPPPETTDLHNSARVRVQKSVALAHVPEEDVCLKGREGKGSNSADTTSTPERQRDALFDALASACGMDYAEMTARQRKSTGVARAELVKVGATPEQVHARAVAYRRKFPNAALTPHALANHWASLRASVASTGTPSRPTVELNGATLDARALQ